MRRTGRRARVLPAVIGVVVTCAGLASCGLVEEEVAGPSRFEPARGVRSACNLAPAGLLGKVAPGAKVTREQGPVFLVDPGDFHHEEAKSFCELKGAAETTLYISVEREGGKKTDAEKEVAQRRDYERNTTHMAGFWKCRLKPVAGVGTRADLCVADGTSKSMIIYALNKDISLEIRFDGPRPPGEGDMTTLAKTVVGAL